MFGINLKVLVAMVTELRTHSISAKACNACHAPQICILNTSANFEDKYNFSQVFFSQMSQLMRLWHFSHRRPAKAQASLCIRALARAFTVRRHDVWK